MYSVAKCISATDERLQSLIDSGEKSQSEFDILHDSLDMSPSDWVSLQDLKSIYAGSSVLSSDAAIEIYNLLGSSVDEFNRSSLAIKIVLTEIHAALLKHKMNQ